MTENKMTENIIQAKWVSSVNPDVHGSFTLNIKPSGEIACTIKYDEKSVFCPGKTKTLQMTAARDLKSMRINAQSHLSTKQGLMLTLMPQECYYSTICPIDCGTVHLLNLETLKELFN